MLLLLRLLLLQRAQQLQTAEQPSCRMQQATA
jgi:hypothetical protein